MCHHHDLRPRGCGGDQPSQGIYERGVQAGFWLVQHDEAGGVSREQGRAQQEIPQGAVAEFCRLQRPEDPWLFHDKLKAPLDSVHADTGAGEGSCDLGIEG